VQTKTISSNFNNKFFAILVVFSFLIFVATADGHRVTIDEDIANQEAIRIATMTPDSNYIQGESRLFFEYPHLYPPDINTRPLCAIGILCSASNIGHSISQVPFLVFYNFFPIFSSTNIFENNDFLDQNYVYWKNTLDSKFVFLDIFYGSIFSSLSVGIFYLITREFRFTNNSSLIVTLLYAFSTLTWAYSQSTLNSVPSIFFTLLGFLFFLKFYFNNNNKFLFLSAITLGFGFLVRPDVGLIIVIIFGLFLFKLFKNNSKISNIILFIIPLTGFFILHQIIIEARLDYVFSKLIVGIPSDTSPSNLEAILGLLFSPGVGLFIFVPILLLSFLSFQDFFKIEKKICISFIIISTIFVLFYARLEDWHGLVSWGPRYLLPIIPFLLIPLCASLDKRKHKLFILLVAFLGVSGIFINLLYVTQDVSWFVWGQQGNENGLFALGRMANDDVHRLWINPIVLYTFEFSQLSQSAIWMFTNFQPDLFLFELFGWKIYCAIFFPSIGFVIYFLFKFSKQYNKNLTVNSTSS
jgi:hypothetical protein